MNELLIVMEQFRQQKGRCLLLCVSVALAFMAYGVLGTLRYSLISGDDEVSRSRLIVTHQSGLMETLPLAYLERLRNVPGVAAVGHATWLGVYFQDRRQTLMAFAVDPAAWLLQHPDMQLSDASRKKFVAERDGMLVSQQLADKFGWKPGDQVPLGSILFMPTDGNPVWHYRVSGIFTSTDRGGGRNYIVTHYDYLNQARTFWNNTVGTYMVTAQRGDDVDALAASIDTMFANSDAPTSTDTDQAFHTAFFAQFGNVTLMIKVIVGAAFTSLMLIVTSTLALMVRQATRDIGVLKVIGFSHTRILRMVFFQSGLLVTIGGVAGVAGSAAFNAAITRHLPQFLPDLILPWPVLTEATIIIAAMTIGTGLLPALMALRIRPIDAFAIEPS
jgi:putative ABC transport system permease protein